MDDVPLRRIRAGMKYAKDAGFSDAEIKELNDYVSHIAADPDHVMCFIEAFGAYTSEKPFDSPPGGVEFEKRVSSPSLFNLAVLFSLVPDMKALYEKKGYTQTMFREGLRDLKIWSDWTRENFNEPGIAKCGGFNWILYQIHGLVLRFGRLQCNLASSYFSDSIVLRNRATREIATMLDIEADFLENGLCALNNEKGSFRTSRIVFTADSVTGFVCDRTGRVQKSPVSLQLSEWETIVKGGDPAVNLHIPADGPMPWSACVDSMKKMYEFNRGNVKAFICETWFLDPAFSEILPASSNILDFHRHVHVMPYHGGADTVRRVFGVKALNEGLDSVPHDSSIRKALAAYVHSGGKFRNGAMFLLPDEIGIGC